MLEKNGVRIAAVSYDAQEKLAAFAQKYGIGYPLPSDSGSAAIRRFGILNFNMAPDLRSYGVPHPVEYLVAPDGVVIRKYFVPNYQHRVTASAVALREFGEASESAAAVTLQSGTLTVKIGLATDTAFAGQELSYVAHFSLEPGRHIYGDPSPSEYTTTAITFDDPRIVRQTLDLPQATPLDMPALGETVSVYGSSFTALGTLLLKFPLPHGGIVLHGHVSFQQCSGTICEPPQQIPFDLPLTLEPFLTA